MQDRDLVDRLSMLAVALIEIHSDEEIEEICRTISSFLTYQDGKEMDGVNPDYIIYHFPELRQAIDFFE